MDFKSFYTMFATTTRLEGVLSKHVYMREGDLNPKHHKNEHISATNDDEKRDIWLLLYKWYLGNRTYERLCES